MKGRRAELSVRTINRDKSSRNINMGASHHLLRQRMKYHISLNRESLSLNPLPLLITLPDGNGFELIWQYLLLHEGFGFRQGLFVQDTVAQNKKIKS